MVPVHRVPTSPNQARHLDSFVLARSRSRIHTCIVEARVDINPLHRARMMPSLP